MTRPGFPPMITISSAEGGKFWLRLMNELKSRGVEEVLILVCDGLTVPPAALTCLCGRPDPPPEDTGLGNLLLHDFTANQIWFTDNQSWLDLLQLAADLLSEHRRPQREDRPS